MVEAISISETFIDIYLTTRRNIPEETRLKHLLAKMLRKMTLDSNEKDAIVMQRMSGK
jgi:CRISPR/Cas system CSM-associated protein Csm2 small subunit